MRECLKYIITQIMRGVKILYSIFPISNRTILFINIQGGGKSVYSCNCKYITEALMEKWGNQVRVVWLVKNKREYNQLREKGICVAYCNTIKSLYYCFISKVVITNGGYVSWFPFRSNQYIVNTWHGGGAYKKVESDVLVNNWFNQKRLEHERKNISCFISSSEKFTQFVIRGAFDYTGKVIECGMPRNDLMLHKRRDDIEKKVKKFFDLPESTYIMLYAPTFRRYDSANSEVIDIEEILHALKIRFRHEWVFLYRPHTKMNKENKLMIKGTYIDASDYEDMQELLYATDFLITDYSSIIWDYSLSLKPMVLYVPDVEEYRKETGLYIDICKWNLPMVMTVSQLVDYIKHYDQRNYTELVSLHHKQLGNKETGKATDIVVEDIINNLRLK